MSNSLGITIANMDGYKVNERAWGLVLAALTRLRASGTTYDQIGQLIGVDKSTIKLWVDRQRRGDRVAFGNMVRYLDRLQIPLDEVFGVHIDRPSQARPRAEALDKAIARVLSDVMQALGKSRNSIMRHASVATMDPQRAIALLDGEEQFAVADLLNLCAGIGVQPSEILARAVNIANEQKSEVEARHTA